MEINPCIPEKSTTQRKYSKDHKSMANDFNHFFASVGENTIQKITLNFILPGKEAHQMKTFHWGHGKSRKGYHGEGWRVGFWSTSCNADLSCNANQTRSALPRREMLTQQKYRALLTIRQYPHHNLGIYRDQWGIVDSTETSPKWSLWLHS